MNTAAGLVGASPLQAALQIPADTATPVATPGGGDFAMTLAAACLPQSGISVPEGMESAAALAWLADVMSRSSTVPVQESTALPAQLPVPASTQVLAESPKDLPVQAWMPAQELLDPPLESMPVNTPVVEDSEPADAPDSDAVLDFLQDMLAAATPVKTPEQLAPSTAAVPVESAAPAESGDAPVVVPSSSRVMEPAITLTAKSEASSQLRGNAPASFGIGDAYVEPEAAATDLAGAGSAAPVATRPAAAVLQNPLFRVIHADHGQDAQAAVQGGAAAAVAVASDSSASHDSPESPEAGARLISALAERMSARPDAPGVQVESDRSAIGATSPYASVRDAVASVAGSVSTRAEVVHSTVGSPRWANEVGSRLLMMTVRGQQEGSLSLTPEHLGPMEVRISVNQDTTNVWFGAQHADTRAALADALPRLREMFAASGLSLGEAGVSHDMPGQDARRSEGTTHRAASPTGSAEILPAAVASRVSSGLLDTWA